VIEDLGQHPLGDELAQPVGEQVAGDAQPSLERLEAADPQEAIAKDQQRPAVADDGDGSGNRAFLIGKRNARISGHDATPVDVRSGIL
jgi:hypothetical protein